MPFANIRGVNINYEILGERGPLIALQPGGRRAGAALRPLAAKVAEAGYRVIIYDRRNCGASASPSRGSRKTRNGPTGIAPAFGAARCLAGLYRRQLVEVPAGDDPRIQSDLRMCAASCCGG